MPVNVPNVYDTVKEANMRLQHTVIMYDGDPYFVVCVTDHKSDGIFRIYMEPCGHPGGLEYGNCPYGNGASTGQLMDEYLEYHKKTTRIVRKQMNSPMFNRFRPFPLGMCDNDGTTFYLERAPLRSTQQGMTRDSLVQTAITLDNSKPRFGGVDMYGAAFKATCRGEYLSPQEALEKLSSGAFANRSLSFHRNFCFVKGPVGTMFLAYKTEIVGKLPTRDFSELFLVKKYFYTQEVIQELGVFNSIKIADK